MNRHLFLSDVYRVIRFVLQGIFILFWPFSLLAIAFSLVLARNEIWLFLTTLTISGVLIGCLCLCMMALGVYWSLLILDFILYSTKEYHEIIITPLGYRVAAILSVISSLWISLNEFPPASHLVYQGSIAYGLLVGIVSVLLIVPLFWFLLVFGIIIVVLVIGNLWGLWAIVVSLLMALYGLIKSIFLNEKK